MYINIIANNHDNFSIEKKSKLNRFMSTTVLSIVDLTRLEDARFVAAAILLMSFTGVL